MNKLIKPKLIVILGPTSSGKTGLAVKLAAMFKGEIVSADSRQVYRGMDIGTGKDLKEYRVKITREQDYKRTRSKTIEIPYHLIDVVSPKTEFSLGKYKRMADQAILDVAKRGKLPFLVGGSGLYLQAVVDNFQLSKIKADKALREKLETMTVEELFAELKRINPDFAIKLNESDRKNKRRLIRYVEIHRQDREIKTAGPGKYDVLVIGLERGREELAQKIYQRLLDRIETEGMIDEIKHLHETGVSWKRLESFGLEYKFVSRHLQGKLSYDEMVEKLFIAIRQFAKRQMTWFRRWEKQGREINWAATEKEAEKMIKVFMK